MVRYANKDYLSCQDLRLFLETEQGVGSFFCSEELFCSTILENVVRFQMSGVTTEFCENVVEQYEPASEAKEHNFMTVDGSLT